MKDVGFMIYYLLLNHLVEVVNVCSVVELLYPFDRDVKSNLMTYSYSIMYLDENKLWYYFF